MSDTNDIRVRASSTIPPRPDADDDGSDDDTGVTTMDTSLAISPTQASTSSAFRPKEEPRAPRQSNGRRNLPENDENDGQETAAADDADDDDDAMSASASEDELGDDDDDDDDQMEERQRELELIEQAHGGGVSPVGRLNAPPNKLTVCSFQSAPSDGR